MQCSCHVWTGPVAEHKATSNGATDIAPTSRTHRLQRRSIFQLSKLLNIHVLTCDKTPQNPHPHVGVRVVRSRGMGWESIGAGLPMQILTLDPDFSYVSYVSPSLDFTPDQIYSCWHSGNPSAWSLRITTVSSIQLDPVLEYLSIWVASSQCCPHRLSLKMPISSNYPCLLAKSTLSSQSLSYATMRLTPS